MTVYAYRGRTGAGAVAGELEATDRMAAVAQLRSRGVVATAVQEKKAKTGGFTFSFAKTFGGRVSDKDIAIHTRQFSTMVDAGLPLAQCLTILGEHSDSKTLREAATSIAHEVDGGAILADSLRKFPAAVDELVLVVHPRGAGRVRLRLQKVLLDRPGQPGDRRAFVEGADRRHAHPKGRGGPLHPHPRHADLVRCPDPGGLAHHRPLGRQPG